MFRRDSQFLCHDRTPSWAPVAATIRPGHDHHDPFTAGPDCDPLPEDAEREAESIHPAIGTPPAHRLIGRG
ncbi:hypothetical protein MMUR_18450 [Mycolicibacterium murale]|uniref:Uncharacterized protein n=1 Tax=Mycolicibacterium murale TaxID=182220 RepID=A0A7I9WJE2_9MYCO|nr:hypothetical protein MMUR_18450 [Mycolicibacterium murale]